jgi:hypothetical protein
MSYRNVLTELEEKLLQLKFKEMKTYWTTQNKVKSTVFWNITPYSLIEHSSSPASRRRRRKENPVPGV